MNKFKSTIVLALSLCALSCKKDSNTSKAEAKPVASVAEIPEELLPLARFLSTKNGIKIENIAFRKRDSAFVMEGDMVVKQSSVVVEMSLIKDNDRKISSTSDLKAPSISQQRSDLLITITSYPTIRVRNLCSSNTWLLATSQAIRNFNHPSVTAMTKIRMVEVTSGRVDVTVSENGLYSNDNNYAEALSPNYVYPLTSPYNKKPGTNVYIYTNGNYISEGEKELVITHELGHTIGFKHTNPKNNVHDGVHIEYSPWEDSGSFMNMGGSFGQTPRFKGFSNNDIWAMYTMYPQTIPYSTSISGNATNLSGTVGYMWATGSTPASNGNFVFKMYTTNGFQDLAVNYYGSGVKIAAMSGENYYYITADKKIYHKSSTYPIQLPGEAIDIAANSSGEVFIVSNTPVSSEGNQVMKWNGASWDNYQQGSNYSGAKKIALPAGPNASPFIVNNSGQVFYANDGGWLSAGVNTAAISIAACNNKLDISRLPIVYIISTNESRPGGYCAFRWTGSDWFGGLPGGGTQVGVDGNGRPWVSTNTGSVFANSNF